MRRGPAPRCSTDCCTAAAGIHEIKPLKIIGNMLANRSLAIEYRIHAVLNWDPGDTEASERTKRSRGSYMLGISKQHLTFTEYGR